MQRLISMRIRHFFDMLEAKVRDFYFTQPEDEDAAVQEDSEKSEAEE